MKTSLFVLSLALCSTGFAAPMQPNPFAFRVDSAKPVTYTNPVLPGMYCDPSVCRVGDDYYLITSTFGYFPGIPVFHSKDLVNWEQIGHCIDRKEQFPNGLNIFACTIRHHDGVFYMITTTPGTGGNFFMTATNPAGPWSDPVWIDVTAIDPDLFFDDDGKVYVISSAFILFEINLKTGKLLTEGRQIWAGTGGRYSEGPHIYKKDGYYYLMDSEGGTEEAHCVNIARSTNIWGPYVNNPANPILAHANAAGQGNPIQGVGHADMVQAHDGSWWMICHGYRTVVNYPVHHILGRETLLVPVDWPEHGWPVVNGNGTVTEKMTCQTLPLKPFPEKPARDEFDADRLGLEWNTVQAPDTEKPFYVLKDGALELTGLAPQLGWGGHPAFVGRRLQHMDFTASTTIHFDPENGNEEAGLALLNNNQHFDLLVKRSGAQRVAYAKLHFGSVAHGSKEIVLKPGPVELTVKGKGGRFIFSCSQDGQETEIESVDARYLSTETVGWFTGVHVGFYATGNGKPCEAAATFDWFEYAGKSL
jgi:alpha-N-arabinofuranosidase